MRMMNLLWEVDGWMSKERDGLARLRVNKDPTTVGETLTVGREKRKKSIEGRKYLLLAAR